MFRSSSCALILAASLCFAGSFASAGELADASPPLVSRMLAITDVVLEQHVDPPARQQMLLRAAKALYQAAERAVPKGLSTRVSEIAARDQCEDYLRELIAEFDALSEAESILAAGILSSLPGGANLVDEQTDKVDEQLRANRYVGTGIALSWSNNRPQISKVFFDGPAWKAGVKHGDSILEIDRESTESLDMQAVIEQLRGEEGSEVTVVVQQQDSEDPRTLTVTRGRVFIPSVEGYREEPAGRWQFTSEFAKEIAFLRIRRIGPSTLHELRQVEAAFRDGNLQGIVLDLRDGGGTLHDIVMVADSLLDGGTIGHIQSFDSITTHEARPGALFSGLPMAVLVGEQLSAGNVFLAAALQDNRRAVVVGQPTSGTAYVRTILPIPGHGGKIVLPTAVLQRGDGTPLQTPPHTSQQAQQLTRTEDKPRPRFIVPDHVVGDRRNRRRTGGDPVLAKAIEVLRAARGADQHTNANATETSESSG